jgi:hypothetical protein
LVNPLGAEDIPIAVKANGGAGCPAALSFVVPFVISLLKVK